MLKIFKGGPRQRVEQTKREVEHKWSGRAGTNLSYPYKNIEEPIRHTMLSYCAGLVCEVGCGDGRIAQHIPADRYIGLDINNYSITKAKESYPRHDFRLIKWEDEYPDASTYLFYTVLLHIPDSEIEAIIKKLDNRVIIVESMNRWIRDYGKGNNYQRDPSEYRSLFKGFNEIIFAQASSNHFPFYMNIQVFEK